MNNILKTWQSFKWSSCVEASIHVSDCCQSSLSSVADQVLWSLCGEQINRVLHYYSLQQLTFYCVWPLGLIVLYLCGLCNHMSWFILSLHTRTVKPLYTVWFWATQIVMDPPWTCKIVVSAQSTGTIIETVVSHDGCFRPNKAMAIYNLSLNSAFPFWPKIVNLNNW